MFQQFIPAIANVASSIFGRQKDAVESPQITNIQTVGERDTSGTENYGGQVMQANPLAAFGPQVVNLLVNSEQTAAHLAKKFGVPDTLIRDVAERQQIVAAAQQMAQQQMQQPQQGMGQGMEEAPSEQIAAE